MIGKTILHYKIIEKLGEGGMGVVYKAEDTKLERTVALKFLPTNTLVGEEDKKRFKREAKAAAALNHANICHIYAIDEVDDQLFIAMEFINGKSIEDIVGANGRSPLPLDDAINYATQAAAGLQTAHETGVIHRDIKSANIMVTEKGVVKIMDFGLAKLANRSKMTVQGSTLGTAAYMSPEQARGEALDKRSDIWSLGVVLYEMISGQIPFPGDYEQAVIYSILNKEPEPLTAVRSGLPIALDGIIAKALAKDPKIRYQHVDELPADLKALDTAALNRSRIASAPQPFEDSKHSKGLKLPWIIAALSGVAVVTALLFAFRINSPAPETVRVNLSVLTVKNQSLLRTDVQALTLSPDGRTLVYTLSEKGKSLLYLRSLNDFAAIPIKGTTNARSPFFSPDGLWIGFVADGKIKKVSISGGTIETICDAPGFRGASWGADDNIIFSPNFGSGLMAISASGGKALAVSRLDTTQFERTHRWPQVLPGGEWVLYTIGDQSNPNSYVDARLAIQSIKTGVRHILDVRGEMARYIEPGFLIVARNGVLLAVPFDLKEFRTTQPLVSVIEDVDGDLGSGISYFTLSKNGRLVYVPGIRNQDLELVWVDRQGKIEPLPLPKQPYSIPRLSPDGTRLVVTVGQPGGNSDIWLYDLKSAVFSRFTFTSKMLNPAWGPHGKKVYFNDGGGTEGIMVKPADGSSVERLLHEGKSPLQVVSVSPDGTKLILNRQSGSGEGIIFVLDLTKKQQPNILLKSGFYEYNGLISPDGKFITHGSNETGRLEIFVRTFPDMKGKWQVSSSGGISPLWSHDGKELYYISPVGKMMQISLTTKPVFSAGKPQELFDVTQMFIPNNPIANTDISPDGKRFIMIRNIYESRNTQAFNVILNWTDELQEKLKAGE